MFYPLINYPREAIFLSIIFTLCLIKEMSEIFKSSQKVSSYMFWFIAELLDSEGIKRRN